MEPVLLDETASKQTVSITVNSDLYAKACGAGIDLSRIAEEAVIRALSAKEHRDRLIDEIRRGSEAVARYVEQHGDPVAEWDQMFGASDAA